MKYSIKNSNYRDFGVFRDGQLKPRSYFIPFSDRERAEACDIRNERYSSDMLTVLSGEWDFKYYPHVSDIPDCFDTESERFDRVPVPSCWQFTGYEPPYYVNTRYQFRPDPPDIPEDCPVGVYRKRFCSGDDISGYILTFLGVAGALDVFVNGRYVGYSECGHNTSEFSLDGFVTEGENELLAVVHKYSNSTYLECQDMFRNNGIFRDVLLTKTGGNTIFDFEFRSKKKYSEYSFEVLPDLKLSGECELTVSVYDGAELIARAAERQQPGRITPICFEGLKVKEWSAEIPNLYSIMLVLSESGKAVEAVKRPYGFRTVEIKGNVFLFNGEPVKLLGVNHHDTDPKKGYAMSLEDMERDVRIMKEYNCNCVRTSHYPPDPAFLDFCDEYGLYTVDEADIETHGCQTELHRPGACSHNPKWRSRYLDRVLRMFERDKNHPGVTMWSLGNESWGYSNQDACYEALKKRSDIPVHYEGAVHTRRFAYDVISQMYPWQGKMKKLACGSGLAKKWYEKPYFLCEYAHAMGVGAGELETYVGYFLSAENLMGGCIWEFADHAVYHENSALKYTYGGDHGEEKHDKNFCVDGLFYPDRTPHAGALQMKCCYRPVRAKRNGNRFTFKNYNYFRRVSLTVKWEGSGDYATLGKGEFEISLEPRAETEVVLDSFRHYAFRYFDGKNEIACEQHSASPAITEKPENLHTDNPFKLEVKGNNITLSNNRIALKLGASIYRAPLDNDMYIRLGWKRFALETEKLEVISDTVSENTGYRVRELKGVISTDRIGRLVRFTLKSRTFRNGQTMIKLRCTSSFPMPFYPRFGLTVTAPEEYENVRYFGLGERQNLPDFKEHAVLGEYSLKVCDMAEEYIKPQESAMRCDVRLAEVTDGDGRGVRFAAVDKPFIFSADAYSTKQRAAALHREELEKEGLTFLNFDAYQLGAGSAACGPPPTKNYRKNSLKGCELTLVVMPI